MNEQPEALRLADELEDSLYSADGTSLSPYGQGIADKAAAELRRLHEAHEWQYTMAGQCLRRIEKLEAINQELLEALDFYGRYILRSKAGDASILTPIDHDCGDRARAAIAKAERTTT